MPLVGILIGDHDFSGLVLKINDAKITYGVFIQNVVDFLIVAFCIFIFIKGMNKLKRKPKKEETKEVPKKTDEVILLEEIRDLLKKQNHNTKN